jgi:dienelactone hydrolase
MGLFRKRRREETPPTEVAQPGYVFREVLIAIDPVRLPGNLVVPAGALGVVAFAHGSGSSRFSPRNVAVSKVLHDAGIGTLLFDLLTDEEADDRTKVFDIDLLARRLLAAVKWFSTWPDVGNLPVGFFGASTGAAAALVAAAQMRGAAAAVVSRGGRPDLAGSALGRVTAPTLLIVGGNDLQVLELNREAERQLRCEKRLEIVPGATHLFEEPGTLETVAGLAAAWFAKYLREATPGQRGSLASALE